MAMSYFPNWDTLLFQQDFFLEDTMLFDIPPQPPQPYLDDFANIIPPADSYFNVDTFFAPDPPSENGYIFKRQKLNITDDNVPAVTARKSVSPQSVAARQRRKRISEKTHELGKLVPGGIKMNTAEMFGAAYKYIQFLQAQLGILQSMPSSGDCRGEVFESEELRGLLESTSIQEKLYSAEMCMVPREFVRELASDRARVLESEPRVLKEVKELIN